MMHRIWKIAHYFVSLQRNKAKNWNNYESKREICHHD